MTLSNYDWKSLAEGTPRDREDISNTAINQATADAVSDIRSSVQGLREILFFVGMKASDRFFCEAKAQLFQKEETLLYPRVRWDKRTNTPSFSWERLKRNIRPLTGTTFSSSKGKGHSYRARLPKKNGVSSTTVKVVLTSEYVPLMKGKHSISPHTFDEEPQWAQITGLLTEEDLARCRKIGASLARITQQLSVISRELEELL